MARRSLRLAPIDPDHDDHGGLHRDATVLSRRRSLQLLAGAGAAGLLAACSADGGDNTSGGSSSTSTTAGANSSTTTSSLGTDVAAGAGTEIPDETQGPFPADGSNGPNVLADSGVVRNDLTTSFGSMSGTAEGIPLRIELAVVDAATGSPLPGVAVYAWHCTADGRYSIYEIDDQNYLRGVAEGDDAGRVAFTTVFPGCYAGRWPHVHFEVFDGLEVASAGRGARKVSQLALPDADCSAAYGDPRYGSSADNLSRLSLSTDGVFRDGWTEQLGTVSGSVGEGYVASLLVRV